MTHSLDFQNDALKNTTIICLYSGTYLSQMRFENEIVLLLLSAEKKKTKIIKVTKTYITMKNQYNLRYNSVQKERK